MKFTKLVFIFIISIMSVQAVVDSTGCQLYYEFDSNDATDTMGNYDGTVNDNALDWQNSGVKPGFWNWTVLGAGNITVAQADGGLKGMSTFAIDTLVNIRSCSTTDEYTIASGWSGTSTEQSWIIRYDCADNQLDCYIDTNNGLGSDSEGVSLEDGDWHHVACVYDGVGIQIYLDGTAVGTAAGHTGTMEDGTEDIKIGQLIDGDGFIGGIDELSIWNRNISAAEVSESNSSKRAGNSPYAAVSNPTAAQTDYWYSPAGNASANCTTNATACPYSELNTHASSSFHNPGDTIHLVGDGYKYYFGESNYPFPTISSGNSTDQITYKGSGNSDPEIYGIRTNFTATGDSDEYITTATSTLDIGSILCGKHNLVGHLKQSTAGAVNIDKEIFYNGSGDDKTLIHSSTDLTTMECYLQPKDNTFEISGKQYVNIYDFEVYGSTGAHVIAGSSTVGINISNMTIYHIGGSYQSGTLRYGNAIEFGLDSDKSHVWNNLIFDAYDAGITWQGWTGGGNADVSNHNWHNNLIVNCTYGLEIFHSSSHTGSTLENFRFHHNTIEYTGGGFGNDDGHTTAMSIRATNVYNVADSVYIYDNIIGNSTNRELWIGSLFAAVLDMDYNTITDDYLINTNFAYYDGTYYTGSAAYIDWRVDSGMNSNGAGQVVNFNDTKTFIPNANQNVCTASSTGGYVGYAPCSGLVGPNANQHLIDYAFTSNSSTISDGSGSGNDGILYSADVASTAPWETGGYVELDGKNDWINVSGFSLNGLESFTVESLFRANEGNYTTIADITDQMRLRVDGGNTAIFRIYDSNGVACTTPQADIDLDTWYKITGVYLNDTVWLFLNETLQSSRSCNASLGQASRPLHIGVESPTANVFNGSIDDFNIWSNHTITDAMYWQMYPRLINGLVLNMTFTDDDGAVAVDYSGEGNNGTVTGATWTGFGVTDGGAMSFDGDDKITPSQIDAIDVNGSFTVSMWFNADVIDSNDFLIAQAKASNNRFAIAIDNTRVRSGTYDGTTQKGKKASDTISANRWYHMVYSYNQGTADLYLNSINQTSIDYADTSSTLGFEIGVRNGDAGFFNGQIDQIAIWSRALNSTEISNIYESEKLTHQGTLSLAGDAYNNTNTNWTMTVANPITGTSYYNTSWFDTPQKDAVLVMPFNTPAAEDISGNGNNGTVTGATWCGDCGHDGSGAYEFDGDGDYINIDNSDFGNWGDTWSVGIWAEFDNYGYNTLFADRSGSAGVGFAYNDDKFQLNAYGLTDTYMESSDSLNLILDTWYHIVAGYNGTHMYVFVNGQINFTDDSSGTVTDTANDLKIGYMPGFTTRNMTGTIDDVRIYNYSLSAAQVQALYEQGNVLKADETDYNETWTGHFYQSNGITYDSDTVLFTTDTEPDSTAPTLSDLSVSSTTSTATFTFSSDEYSTANVEYGETQSLGLTSSNSLGYDHVITITGLESSAPYFYNITACDASSNCYETGPGTFSTDTASTGGGGGGSSSPVVTTQSTINETNSSSPRVPFFIDRALSTGAMIALAIVVFGIIAVMVVGFFVWLGGQ
jgi:hypothetical protein